MFRPNTSTGTGTNRTRGRFLSVKRRAGKRISWRLADNKTDSASPSPGKSPSNDNDNENENMPSPTAALSTIHDQPTVMAPPSADGFSQQEIRDFQGTFDLFDTSGTGVLEIGPFRKVLESLRAEDQQSYPHLESILGQLSGVDDRATLDFSNYLELMANTSLQRRLSAGGPENEFQHVFDLFDADRKGYISVEDLEQVAIELGERDMTREELQEMIDRANSKTNGGVTIEEFSRIMTLNLFEKLEQGNERPQESN